MNRALIGHSRDRENVQTPLSAREAWWGAGGGGGGIGGRGARALFQHLGLMGS